MLKTYLDHLDQNEIINLGKSFKNSKPFNHIIIDDFLSSEDALIIANEFPSFDDEFWFSYNNPLEIKKASNDWNHFGCKTYEYFKHILSESFCNKLNLLFDEKDDVKLTPDIGLHGGGYHCHKNGGRLNPHLDYSIHPKLFLQRKVNIILYINPEWKKEYGGALGLWSDNNGQPDKLINKVDCIFNRALIFDTTQNSWHGICNEINAPNNITRNSLATYYLTIPDQKADPRMKVKYAPREDQKGDESIKDLINKRQSMSDFQNVYRTK